MYTVKQYVYVLWPFIKTKNELVSFYPERLKALSKCQCDTSTGQTTWSVMVSVNWRGWFFVFKTELCCVHKSCIRLYPTRESYKDVDCHKQNYVYAHTHEQFNVFCSRLEDILGILMAGTWTLLTGLKVNQGRTSLVRMSILMVNGGPLSAIWPWTVFVWSLQVWS